MPRVNLGTDKRDEALTTLIALYKAKRKIKTEELIKKTGLKRSTYYSKAAKPTTFTLLELRIVLDALNVPTEERRDIL